MSSGARHRICRFWDEAIASFLGGGPAVPRDLRPWFASYVDAGEGEVVLDALPEPFLGSLSASSRMVFLALNPGRAFEFQHRHGSFARRINELGSYTAWAASWPYLNGDWETEVGRPNRHHVARLNFMRRWHDDVPDPIGPEHMSAFELYPWHSTRVTGRMRPDPTLIREFVWEPIAEIGAQVFAFGAAWFAMLEKGLGLSAIDRLGAGGRDYGSAVPSRSVMVFETPAGVPVVAEKHAGSAGPPNVEETRRLRDAIDQLIGGAAD